MNCSPDQIVDDLRRFIMPSYPEIDIRVTPWDCDPARLAIYFTDPNFALIYPIPALAFAHASDSDRLPKEPS